MAVKLSDLTTESSPASNDILLIADPVTGVARKITVSALKTYMDGLGGGGDATAPTIVSATATTASTIVIVFSENVTVTTAGWSFKKNGVAWTISSVTGSGSTWTFTMSTSGASGDTILRSYDSATGGTVDTASNELATFTDSAVTNSIPGGYQAETTDFINAVEGTGASLSATIKDALDSLVVSMKGIGWAKFQAIYPFVGGTANAHKFNMKNPLDTDAAFRIVWSGSGTHSSTGWAGNGSTGYGDTKYGPSDMTQDSVHASVYSGTTAGADDSYILGAGGASGTTPSLFIIPRTAGDKFTAGANETFNAAFTPNQQTNTDGKGFYAVSRTGASAAFIMNSAGTVYNNTNASAGESTATVAISRMNDYGAGYSSQSVRFVSLGTALTSGEMETLRTAVVAFQTALGRA